MPWTPKQHRFFEMCKSASGRAKARAKCPAATDAARMAAEGIKASKAKKPKR